MLVFILLSSEAETCRTGNMILDNLPMIAKGCQNHLMKPSTTPVLDFGPWTGVYN